MAQFELIFRILLTGLLFGVAVISLFKPGVVLRTMYGSEKLSTRKLAIRGLQVAAGLLLTSMLLSLFARKWL